MIDLTGKTMASILGSMLLRITEQVNKREGSLIRTALSAAAWAIEGIYIELIDVQKQAYGVTATGDYLDLKAEERGVYRIPATQAVYEMKSNISALPLNFQLADQNGYTWNVTTGVLYGPDTEGLYLYHITCQTAGVIPEPSGSLRSLSFYNGLTTAVFGSSVSPGTDIESDESLRRRYEESLVEIAFAGNVDAYREKILSMTYDVSGGSAVVGALQVYPTTDADGSSKGGHVKIWILNSNLEVASNALVQAVQNEICPMYNGVSTGDGFGWAPIGANVHIATATSTPILSMMIFVTLANASLDAVTEQIKANVMSYVRTLKEGWMNQVPNREASASIVIREAFIYAAALVPGVVDVTEVRLYKEGVLTPQSVSWVTNTSIMEWIVDSSIAITVLQNP